MLSKTGEIRRDEACLDYSGSDVVLYPCHGSKGNQVNLNSIVSIWRIPNKICSKFFSSRSIGYTTPKRINCVTDHPINVYQ